MTNMGENYYQHGAPNFPPPKKKKHYRNVDMEGALLLFFSPLFPLFFHPFLFSSLFSFHVLKFWGGGGGNCSLSPLKTPMEGGIKNKPRGGGGETRTKSMDN